MGGVRFKADPEEENFTEKHADPTGAGYATLKGEGCNIWQDPVMSLLTG